jgi:hypothetical protein
VKHLLKAALESKKLAATLVSVLCWIATRLGWDLASAELLVLVGAIQSYVLAQGWADKGKEAAKLTAAERRALLETTPGWVKMPEEPKG